MMDGLHECHGKSMELSEQDAVGTAKSGTDREVFSKLPLQPGNSFTVRVEEAQVPNHWPSLRLGLTCQDPASWNPNIVTISMTDTWTLDTWDGRRHTDGKRATDTCGKWIETFRPIHQLCAGHTVTITLKTDRSMSVAVNDRSGWGNVVDDVFTGLPDKPLWVVMELDVKKIRVMPQKV